ncbi:MAG: c-type cytochrome [Actinomycetota bacterium]
MPSGTRSAIRAGLVVLATVIGACGGDGPDGASGGDLASRGESLFQENCAQCHGADLKGTKTGPPFLSPIYAPNHHPDGSFHAAVVQGVQPHHWEFGPMPPVPALDAGDVDAIVAYIREQQEAAGITEDPDHP